MLRYLENNEELKVGIAELQVAQQAGHEVGQKVFEIFWHEEEEVMCCQLGQVGCAAERFGGAGRRWQDTSLEIQMLNKRQEMFNNAIEGKLEVQS